MSKIPGLAFAIGWTAVHMLGVGRITPAEAQLEAKTTSASAVGEAVSERGALATSPRPLKVGASSHPTEAHGSRAAKAIFSQGLAAYKARDREQAIHHFNTALEIYERVSDKKMGALCLHWIASVLLEGGNLAQAKSHFMRAHEAYQTLAPDHPESAETLSWLGQIADKNGDFEEATRLFNEALMIYRKNDDLDQEANCLLWLGHVSLKRGNLAAAENYTEMARELYQRIAPEGPKQANTLLALGRIVYRANDYEQARYYLNKALEISRKIPSFDIEAVCLHGLGRLAVAERNLTEAQDHFQQAFQIYEQVTSPDLLKADILFSMGAVALSRDDEERGRDYFNKALETHRKLAPESPMYARMLTAISTREFFHDNSSPEAADLAQKALDFIERIAPNSLDLARISGFRGFIAFSQNELEVAVAHLERSLSILRNLPENPKIELVDVGELPARGDRRRGRSWSRAPDVIKNKLAPGSLDESRILFLLGDVHIAHGDLRHAYRYMLDAVEHFEDLINQVGGPDTQMLARPFFGEYYTDAQDSLLAHGEPELAFHFFDRARARSLLVRLAERDSMDRADIPEELDRKRRRVADDYDRAQLQLIAAEPEKVESVLRELDRLSEERIDVTERIRRTALGRAALHYPQTPTFYEIRKVLDSGTILLAYQVRKNTTILFVVERDHELHVEFLPDDADELIDDVSIFRQLIAHAVPGSPYDDPERLHKLGRSLYENLIEPVADRIEQSDRVLIIPDGPLHHLPFAALVRPEGEASSAQHARYLAEWKPIHTVLSATLYAELQRSRPSSAVSSEGLSLIAFGDPEYPEVLTRPGARSEAISDPEVRAAVDRGLFDWRPLVFSRSEVERIAGLFPPDRVRLFLGAASTEEEVKSLDRPGGIVHFAVHGYFDDRMPVSSALALSIPQGFPAGRDNGVLQVWEILDRVRLDADLVVLSACKSALGQEYGEEGPLGLIRAFHYAGARTVAATLWNIDDQVTAELMVRFYRHLLAGKPKDEALRAAQLELIRDPMLVQDRDGRTEVKDASSPYYWAAFQLYGDWR